MHKSATVQTAVLSGGKIGQKTPPEKKERHKISSSFGQTIKVQMWSHEESLVEKILTLKPLNV